MKKLLFLLALPFILVSCQSSISSDNSSNNDDQNDNIHDNTSSDEAIKNAIVIYFSATSNTEKVANYISTHINSNIYKLEPIDPYTSEDLNYNNSDSRVYKERNDENRNVELETVSFDGFNEAQYIFLGAPIWWGEMSWVIDGFLKGNDFLNKTIIPFATSASSNVSLSTQKDYAKNSNWMTPQRFSSRASESEVISWVDSLNIEFK